MKCNKDFTVSQLLLQSKPASYIEPKSKRLACRITAQEYLKVHQLAFYTKKSVSQILREVLDNLLKQESK